MTTIELRLMFKVPNLWMSFLSNSFIVATFRVHVHTLAPNQLYRD